MLSVAPAHGKPVQILDAGVQGDAFRLRLSGSPARVEIFHLDAPRRVVIDISGAQPGGSGTPGGVVTAIRQGQPDRDTARLVLDLDRPAILSGGYLGTDGLILTFRLGTAHRDDFAAAVGRGRSLVRLAAPAALPLFARQGDHTLAPMSMPGQADAQGGKKRRADNRPLVVIDAGHGGHDPGAVNKETGAREKDIALAIARAVREELLKSGQVRAALTRENDRFLALHERSAMARRMKADLFISIHADASDNPGARGATIYTLSEVASDREAARLAVRENKVNILNGVDLRAQGDDLASILIDLSRRGTMNASVDFAARLQQEAAQFVAFRTNYHRFAAFAVLKAPDMPSVLFEAGYISNADDVQLLMSAQAQSRIARGVARAVEAHFGDWRKNDAFLQLENPVPQHVQAPPVDVSRRYRQVEPGGQLS